MIIVEIRGGLGNQMFQYALGRALALKNRTDVRLDTSAYKAKTGDPMKGVRTFVLSHFNIDALTATPEELKPFARYKKGNLFGKIARAWGRVGIYYTKKYIQEPEKNLFSYDDSFGNYPLTKDVYITGFWQSEKYFSHYKDVIRKELNVTTKPFGKNETVLNTMKNQNAVAIHIRHGDNANTIAPKHGVLPMDFYKEASRIIKEKVSNPVFYLFSDDIPWAKGQLAYLNPVVVDWNTDDTSYEDMRLMSSCKHHIIANSTFSWWGAWVAAHEGQIVIAPKKYHMTGTRSYTDYYPKHWITL